MEVKEGGSAFRLGPHLVGHLVVEDTPVFCRCGGCKNNLVIVIRCKFWQKYYIIGVLAQKDQNSTCTHIHSTALKDRMGIKGIGDIMLK
jgi:hypothetical protein